MGRRERFDRSKLSEEATIKFKSSLRAFGTSKGDNEQSEDSIGKVRH